MGNEVLLVICSIWSELVGNYRFIEMVLKRMFALQINSLLQSFFELTYFIAYFWMVF